MARSIVVGVSPGTDTDAALDWAGEEANRRELPLLLVHSLEWLLRDALPASDRMRSEAIAQGEWLLSRARDRIAGRHPAVRIETSLEVELGPAAALLARDEQAAMVVLGSKHRTALGDLLAVSATTTTLHEAHCPVVVVGAPSPRESGPVVVGVDGSHLSDRALEVAFEEAALRRVPLRAVLAWQQPTAWSAELAPYAVLTADQRQQIQEGHALALAEALAPWAEEHPGVPVEQRLVEGHPGRVLVEASADAGLLVVGSRGRGGFAGLVLGSVSAAVVHHAHAPVMVCHRA